MQALAKFAHLKAGVIVGVTYAIKKVKLNGTINTEFTTSEQALHL